LLTPVSSAHPRNGGDVYAHVLLQPEGMGFRETGGNVGAANPIKSPNTAK